MRTHFSNHKETIINFFWRVLQILGKQGTTFFIFLVCANFLTPYNFGIYNYVFSAIFFLIIFSDFGVSIATSKYTSQFDVESKDKLKLLLFNGSLIIFLLSTLLSIIIYLFWEKFFEYKYILYCIPLLYFIPLSSLYDGIFRGLKKFRSVSVVYLAAGCISIPLFFLLIIRFGLHGAFICQNIYFIFLVCSLAFYARKIGIPAVIKFDREIITKILSYSIVIGIADVGLFLYTRADTLILGKYGLIEEVGYYEIINRMFLLLIMPAQILATVVAPNITQRVTLGKFDLVKRQLKRDVLFLLGCGFLVAAVSYFVFPFIFPLVFIDYDINTLIYLMNIILVIIPFRYFSTYLSIGYITPSGYAKVATYFLLIFGVLNVILDFVFIEPYGVVGVIYATLISQLLFIGTKDTVFYFIVKRRDQG